jgi:ligand-binding SRPBCC domain-containing protein
MAIFTTEVTIPCSIEEAFDFLTTPKTIETISPDAMGLSYVSTPPVYHLGAKIEFKLISFGQVQKITHEVIQFDRPDIFVESMINGPMPRWIHTHRFESRGPEETVVIDEIEFDPPAGLLGFLITEGRILDSLEKGFDERQRLLLQAFEK